MQSAIIIVAGFCESVLLLSLFLIIAITNIC